MTFPELLQLYEQAVNIRSANTDAANQIYEQILADSSCPAQLRMTIERDMANLNPIVMASVDKDEVTVQKEDILNVDPFVIEEIQSIARLMPIAPEQFERLRTSIKKRGIQNPLIITPDFKLLCGYNRLKIAKELGMPTVPAMVKKVAEDNLIDYAIKDNIERRHMSVQELSNFISAQTTQPAGRPKKYSRNKTIGDIAKTLGVSKKTVERAKKFAKKVKENPLLKDNSIKSVIESKSPMNKFAMTKTLTQDIDLDEKHLQELFMNIVDKIYDFDINGGDKIKFVIQVYHIKRK